MHAGNSKDSKEQVSYNVINPIRIVLPPPIPENRNNNQLQIMAVP
jgi:hypothetical protein